MVFEREGNIRTVVGDNSGFSDRWAFEVSSEVIDGLFSPFFGFLEEDVPSFLIV